MTFRILAAFAALSSLAGCSASSIMDSWDVASVDDAEEAQFWSIGSAPQHFFTGLTVPHSLVIGLGQGDSETKGCPVFEQDGDRATLTGGCQTDEREWFGKVTMTGVDDEAGVGKFEYEDFGFGRVVTCENGATGLSTVKLTGTSNVEATGAVGTTRYAYDLRTDTVTVTPADCTVETDVAASNYSGTRVLTGEHNVWNGSGRIGYSDYGTVRVSTVDEVVDSTICETEAASGTTTIQGDGPPVVITYDGATDCSADATVTWTRDGVAMGTLSGVACASATAAPLPFGLSLLALAALRLRRRR